MSAHLEPTNAVPTPAVVPSPEGRGLPVGLPVASSTARTQPKLSATPSPLGASNRQPLGSTACTSAPERLGQQGLEQLRANLSARDQAVVQSVSDYRFLTTKQIEQLHFTGHATPLSAARTARRVLRRLCEHRLLRHLDRRVGGVRAGSASFVWALGPVGDRLLRAPASVENRPRRRSFEPSERFVAHALAIADSHLSLLALQREGQLELVEVQTEPSCWRRYLGPAGEARSLQPDLYVVTANADYEDCWFLEIDLGNEHLPTILAKCHQYVAYQRTGLEQQASGTFPRVVWTMSSLERVTRLRAAIDRVSDLLPGLFTVITLDKLPDVVREASS